MPRERSLLQRMREPESEGSRTIHENTDRLAESVMANLRRLLNSRHGIAMTRIESRPSRRRKWDYVFFVDIDGHADEEPVKQALEEVQANADLFRILGAYPRAVV